MEIAFRGGLGHASELTGHALLYWATNHQSGLLLRGETRSRSAFTPISGHGLVDRRLRAVPKSVKQLWAETETT